MKKIITSLFGAVLSLSLLSSCIVINMPGAEESSSSQSANTQSEETTSSIVISSEESSSEATSEETSSDITSEELSSEVTSEESSSAATSEETSSEEEPSVFEDGTDLATCAPFHSRAPENYGAQNTMSLQSEEVSYNSTVALKGVFNSVGAFPYEGYKVWTWACLDLEEYFTHPADLNNQVLTYEVKMENCGAVSSFIVMAPNGQRTQEVSFAFRDPSQAYPGIECMPCSDGWYRVSIDFTRAYNAHPILSAAAEVLIMFSNENCANPKIDSVFYIDNMSLTDAVVFPDMSSPTDEETSDTPSSSFPDDSDEYGKDSPSPEDSEVTSSEMASEENSSEEEEVPIIIEDGKDLATNAPFHSRAPENYGVENTLSLQSDVVSYNSTVALKGVFNSVGAYPYEGYKVWTWACLDLEEYFKHAVDLDDKILTYEVKPENCGDVSSFIVMASNGQRTQELSFSFSHPLHSYEGIRCVALSNGWYRVTIDFTWAYDGHAILNDAAEILIMFSNENCENPDNNSVFYIDNMSLLANYTPEEGVEGYPQNEYCDMTTFLPFKSHGPGYGATSTLTYDTEVSSKGSAMSLKGVFNSKGANTYEGYMVWTWAEICLEEYLGAPSYLQDIVLGYDVLTENCGIYSSFILVSLDGTYSKEVTFAFNDPTQTSKGIVSTPLTNGWYNVEIDFSVAYADDLSVLNSVSSILIMFSNQDCADRDADSIFHLDNMYFNFLTESPDDESPDDESPEENPEEDDEKLHLSEELDLATNGYVKSLPATEADIISTLTVQSEITSNTLFDSESALQGTFYADTFATTWLVFYVEDFYTQPVPINNSILYFEVKTENCAAISSIRIISSDYTVSSEISFARNDFELLNENVICLDWGNGWTGILIDVANTFKYEATPIEAVSIVCLSFNNKGYETSTEPSVFYLDNVLFTVLPDEEELQDFTTNCIFTSRAPENYGVHNTLTVQSDVLSEHSSYALMGVFNNEGAETHNGYAVWTWASLCLEEFIGEPVPCNDLFLTYDVKVENCGAISSLILVSPDGTYSQEMSFVFDDPLKTYPGITCEALLDGWYRVTVDFNKTFANELSCLDEVSEILIMFTNENCENPEENSIFYMDNMIFSDVNPDEEM